MKGLFSGLLVVTGATAAAVGVLAGVERLLHNPETPSRARRPKPAATRAPVASDNKSFPASQLTIPMPAEAVVKSVPERNFSIKRTKSEVGYVYWILEGYGKYKCFILCDSWDEAVTQAKSKMAEIDALTASPQTVSVSI